jgi:predicted Holliday junction resolvase-like endonuclease
MITEILVIVTFLVVLIVSIFFAHRQSMKIAKAMEEQNKKFLKDWEEYKKESAMRLERKDKEKRAKRMQKLLGKKRIQTYRRNRDVKK